MGGTARDAVWMLGVCVVMQPIECVLCRYTDKFLKEVLRLYPVRSIMCLCDFV